MGEGSEGKAISPPRGWLVPQAVFFVPNIEMLALQEQPGKMLNTNDGMFPSVRTPHSGCVTAFVRRSPLLAFDFKLATPHNTVTLSPNYLPLCCYSLPIMILFKPWSPDLFLRHSVALADRKHVLRDNVSWSLGSHKAFTSPRRTTLHSKRIL